MSLFGLRKKNEEVNKEVNEVKEEIKSCCSGGACDAEPIEKEKAAVTSGESVKVLGSGCTKCNELEANVKKALEELEMNTTIEHVTDFAQIAAYGVMSTPALVVNGKVVSYGKVLKVEEAIKILGKVK